MYKYFISSIENETIYIKTMTMLIHTTTTKKKKERSFQLNQDVYFVARTERF